MRDLDQKISDINMLTKKEQIKLSDELKEIKENIHYMERYKGYLKNK
ncbi:hypothetical protein AAHB56_17870 [Bacillus thuringiensis]